MVNIVRGTSQKPVSAKQLAMYFEKRTDLEGTLYIGYPIIGTAQGGYQIDALLISKQHGVIIFHLVEGTNRNINIEGIQDESFTKLESKLLAYTQLIKRRKLLVEMFVATYAPAWQNYPEHILREDYPILINDGDLNDFIVKCSWDNNEYFEKVNSVIQAVTKIGKKNPRSYVTKEDSRGSKLRQLEESIANLDETQNAAVLETVEGVQRIRGLAGSGKTIVLALKVAYLHATHPDWKIAITFNTRSLKGQFKELITRFSYEHKNQEPDWEKVKIIHAWGSPKMAGIYYEICRQHNIEYLDFDSANKLTLFSEEKFDRICEKALKDIQDFKQSYDVILVDEAQDFSKYFLRLCYEILKQPKRLVYAYDELQSLSDKIMESPEFIFGNNTNGKPKVKLQNLLSQPKQDVVLNTCYRNSRPILASAHALGFGIYRQEGLIQMFDNSQLWLDIGYQVEEGELKDGELVKLVRTAETSPKFLEGHSPIEDLIMFKSFKNDREQIEWLVEQIEKNIKEDELRHDDIMVIHPNPPTTRGAVGQIRELLFSKGINSNLAGVTTSPDDFFSEKAIIFTSIYRAKGNEAAMVYVINAHECFSHSIYKRNTLFTAMTRSQAWLRVLGYGSKMEALEAEFNLVKQNDFALEFKYPTEKEREEIRLISRDVNERKRNRNAKKLEEAIKLLAEGKINKDDLSPEIIEKLKEIIK